MNYEIRMIFYYRLFSSHHSKQSFRKCLTRVKAFIVRAKKTFVEFVHEKEQWSGPKKRKVLVGCRLDKGRRSSRG